MQTVKKITSNVEFVAEDTDGSVDVKFNFDGTNLGGKILVAFEKLYYGEKLYGTHAIWKMKNRLCMYQRWKRLRLIKRQKRIMHWQMEL